jgi:hypothetical protein
MIDVPTYEAGQMIRVRCECWRPLYMRDDWWMVRLPNGYRFPMCVESVDLDGEGVCWVRGKVTSPYHEKSHGVHVNFIDLYGEGTLDTVYPPHVRPSEERP